MGKKISHPERSALLAACDASSRATEEECAALRAELAALRRSKSAYDFGGELAQTYTGRCRCGNKISLSTQQDRDSAEYRTTVYVRCLCGRSVKFTLPVNQRGA